MTYNGTERGNTMTRVYVCEECMTEIPYAPEAPDSCKCGADKDSWVIMEKPESGCGGHPK